MHDSRRSLILVEPVIAKQTVTTILWKPGLTERFSACHSVLIAISKESRNPYLKLLKKISEMDTKV